MGSRVWFVLCGISIAAAQPVPRRYIVELNTEPAFGRSKERTNRALVEKQAVRTAAETLDAQVLDTLDTVANALIVSMDDAKAVQLAALPGVKRVRQARWLRPALDAAIPLHKIADAWNRVGAENAGAGVKIAIIDSGIDIEHPTFQDPGLTVPDGYPKVRAEADTAFTNSKVIAARSYANLFQTPEPDLSARDRVGHGTAAAMAAAGVTNTGPLGAITGAAPKAWLGNYKVFGSTGINDGVSSDVVLKAVDDAVADGMDIISLSLGGAIAPRLQEDLEVEALERVVAGGVLVVAAAGNAGPDLNTMSSPGTTPSVITVGAQASSRIFGAAAITGDGTVFLAIPGSGENSSTPIEAQATDVAALDTSGRACGSLPADSLKGKIALILRGNCTFSSKLNNVQAAGAVAGLVYTHADSPEANITMDVQEATLPAALVSFSDGLALKSRIAATPDLRVTIRFTLGPIPADSTRVAPFSGRGPNVDESIKPDLLAVGSGVYTATQRAVPSGELYGPTGYTVISGTSFSTPIVAGAAAVLKAARPGLTPAHYRSLLINSASILDQGVQFAGAGSLNLDAAIQSTVAAAPVSLSFRSGSADPQFSRLLTISNIGAAAGDYSLKISPRSERPAPVLSATSLRLDPGQSADVSVDFSATALAQGTYEGFITISDPNTKVDTRVPYWYAVAADAPGSISVIEQQTSGRAGARLRDAFFLRVTDASGVILRAIEPKVTVVSGGGEVAAVSSIHQESPGVWAVSVRLGALAGENRFRIAAGDVSRDISIQGQ